jgi:glycosyltransferase involved in cell wall biosynthesis
MNELRPSSPQLVPDERPGLAIIANCMTPYRANLHALIAAGVGELKLHTLITHGPADFDWSVHVPASINATYFAEGDDSPLASPLHAPLREWRKGKRLIEYLHSHQVGAVICHGYRYLSYLRTIQHCHRHSIPMFYRNDSNIRSEDGLSRGKQFFKRLLYAWWMPRVDGVMPMGEFGDQFFLKYGADPERMYRVPYTPDYEFFAAVDGQRLDQFRQKYGLRAGRRYFVYSGRLVPVKRVDLLISAFAAIAADRPEWDLLIVGEGRLRDELRRLLPEGLRSRVVWSGFLDQNDSKLAYHSADVLVLPSDREPWGVVVQEAMAAGLAVVASDVVGAAHELVDDGVSGRIFEVGNVESLQRAMRDVSQSERIEGFKKQSKAALEAWRAQLDPVAEVRRALRDCGLLAS